jgi:hypothetical protein
VSRLTTRERPTLGALLTAFLTALVTWGLSAVPDTVPDQVVDAGYALVLFGIAVVVGQLVQRLGARAPWAVDSHATAVAYALTLNPDDHPLDREQLDAHLAALGIDDVAEVRRRIGLDPQEA